MRIIRCDRCGKEMSWNDVDNVGYVALRWKDIRTDELAGPNPYEDVELCEDCMRSISGFIEQKPEPAAEPGKGIDTGKIKALRDAGWTPKKIADELKVSPSTITYHLKRLYPEQYQSKED